MRHRRPTRSDQAFGALLWSSALALSAISWWAMWAAARTLASQVDPVVGATLAGDAGLATATVGATMALRTAILANRREPVPARRPTRRG